MSKLTPEKSSVIMTFDQRYLTGYVLAWEQGIPGRLFVELLKATRYRPSAWEEFKRLIIKARKEEE